MWWAWMLGLAFAQDHRLVAAYDASAVASLAEEESAFVWLAEQGMVDSCGPAKSPDGLGIFEAQAIASGLMPSLALVVERMDPSAPRLTADQVRIALGEDDLRVLLQPMVEPRHLAVRIDADPELARYQQLVRTQVEVETCLEHKTGRAWTGHEIGRLRQAFLLDPPAGRDPSRKFFGGQQDPVPALVGPPDACLVVRGDDVALPTSGRGEGSLSLVPTDVWGATLRACGPYEEGGREVVDHRPHLPLFLTGDPTLQALRKPSWTALDIALTMEDGDGEPEDRLRVTMDVGGERRVDAALFERQDDGTPGILDLLPRVPYHYPTVGPEDDPHRYTVLFVPNWQIVEALRRLERGDADTPLATSPIGVTDGVGVVLEHPEMLFVQIAPDDADADAWPNLAGVMRSEFLGGPWGYAVSSTAARSPIVLPRPEPPSIWQTAVAQRTREQAVLLGSVFLLLLALVAGLRRLRDLWARVPVERADYWPGMGDNELVETEWNQPSDEEGGA